MCTRKIFDQNDKPYFLYYSRDDKDEVIDIIVTSNHKIWKLPLDQSLKSIYENTNKNVKLTWKILYSKIITIFNCHDNADIENNLSFVLSSLTDSLKIDITERLPDSPLSKKIFSFSLVLYSQDVSSYDVILSKILDENRKSMLDILELKQVNANLCKEKESLNNQLIELEILYKRKLCNALLILNSKKRRIHDLLNKVDDTDDISAQEDDREIDDDSKSECSMKVSSVPNSMNADSRSYSMHSSNTTVIESKNLTQHLVNQYQQPINVKSQITQLTMSNISTQSQSHDQKRVTTQVKSSKWRTIADEVLGHSDSDDDLSNFI